MPLKELKWNLFVIKYCFFFFFICLFVCFLLSAFLLSVYIAFFLLVTVEHHESRSLIEGHQQSKAALCFRLQEANDVSLVIG